MFLQDARLALTAANFPQQTITVPLPRAWPIEYVDVICTVVVTAGAPLGAAITHGLINLLRRAKVEVTDDSGPRTVMNVTGPGVLQLNVNEGTNLDRGTWSAIADSRQALVPGTAVYQITYRLNFVHPAIVGALRPRMLLPVHLHPQDPILTLDFEAAANIHTTANPFSAATVEVVIHQREIPRNFAMAINKDSGGNPLRWFLRSDVVETQNAIANGTTGEQRFTIPAPGQYSGLAIYHIQGGAALALADISQAVRSTAGAGAGAETKWTLESGGNVIHAFRMKHARVDNDFTRANLELKRGLSHLIINRDANGLNTNAAAAAQNTQPLYNLGPNFGGAATAGVAEQDPSSIYLDFLTDGQVDAGELGSLLDCNLPVATGLKMELVGNVNAPAGANGSQVNLVGRRFFDDLTPWQTLAKLAA